MAKVPPSDGDLPVDPLFGDWLNGSPAKGGAASAEPAAGDSRFMDAVLGAGADTPDGPPVPESTPFSEAVFGGAVQSGPPGQAVHEVAVADALHVPADDGNGADVGHRRRLRGRGWHCGQL